MSNLISKPVGEFLVVDSKRKIVLLIDKIIMLEGRINYTIFHLKDGKKRLYSHTLHTYEADLMKHGFIRVHRGFMVNIACVQNYKIEEKMIVMENNLIALVSRRKGGREEVKILLTKSIDSPRKVLMGEN